MMTPKQEVLSVGAIPPEKLAYALARYSRSSDSIADSVKWVRERGTSTFLESFYFQYGHASIADLGHIPLCFEGISELAATEIEDEQLWDGQARSSRYQDFSKSGYVIPPGISTPEDMQTYGHAADKLLEGYAEVHEGMVRFYMDTLEKPDSMDQDAYLRTVRARAFDVARYLLFWGIPTGVGQVTSIRTLEKQMARLLSSPYAELHEIAAKVGDTLRAAPDVTYDGRRMCAADEQQIAPTLAAHIGGSDKFLERVTADLQQWLKGKPFGEGEIFVSNGPEVKLTIPANGIKDIVASLLYPLCDWSYSDLYWTISDSQRREILDIVYTTRQKEELPRAFRTTKYAFDITMDLGAYRDLHRHRRVQHFRKPYTAQRGFAEPNQVIEAGMDSVYRQAVATASSAFTSLPPVAREYVLPFATYGRFLMKMDYAEVDYICRLRTGVKGHFSYRDIAWQMAQEMKRAEPHLAPYVQATSPEVVDELKR